MEAEPAPPPYIESPKPPSQGGGNGLKKAAGPLAFIGALLLKFKSGIFVLLKFFPFISKIGWTAGTMILSLGAYTVLWGWKFALGFVLLILVHECGHLIAARMVGLKVTAPMFIPFLGAVILLKEAPRNAWIEAIVGIGGPLLGTLGAVVCFALYLISGSQIFEALAFTGFFINLFNLIPIGFLDGGRIVTVLSPWLWLAGAIVMGLLLFLSFNSFLLVIFVMSLPRLFSLFRKKSPAEARYFEVPLERRLIMGGMYFALIAFLVWGMLVSHVQTESGAVIQ